MRLHSIRQFINKKSSVWQHCQRHCFSCLLNSVTTAFSPERIGNFTNGDVSGLLGKTIRTALKHCEHSEELPVFRRQRKFTKPHPVSPPCFFYAESQPFTSARWPMRRQKV